MRPSLQNRSGKSYQKRTDSVSFIYSNKIMYKMKALHYSLKSLLATLVMVSLFVSSCKHHEEPVPDVATKVSGTYSFTEIIFDGETIPASQTSIKGTIRIDRITDSTVDVQLNLRQKANNDEFMVELAKGVVVSEGSDAIDLFYEGKRVAQMKGNKLMVNSVDESGESFIVVATK